MARRRQRAALGADDVPRLPRGRGISLSMAAIVKIALTATLLVAVILFRKPCGDATAKFIGSFDPQPDAAPALPPDLPPGIYVRLQGLNEEETKAAIDKARAEQAASEQAGSGSATGSGSGSN